MEDSPVRKRKNRKRRVNRAGLLHATILLLGTVVFSSCLAPQQIFTTEIDEFGWPAEREVSVEVSNADTVSLRSLHVVVRYGNEYTPVSDILAYRYEARLPTIMTTNIANVEIRPKYGDRIAARMNEMFDIIVMPDIDFRVKINEYTFLNKL